jgi:aspartate aminotransferase
MSWSISMEQPLTLNPLLDGVKESATLAINQKVAKFRAQGQSIIHFGFGQSPFPVASEIKQALIEHAGNKHYLQGEGLAQLRHTISSYFQQHFDYHYKEEDVFIAPGSKEALFDCLYCLEGPLLLPSPSWVSYKPQAMLLGKEIYPIQTQFDNNYCLQANELEMACQQFDINQQKLLILNSPNNPTGLVYSQETLNELVSVCQKYNIIVISDEIYAGTEFNGTNHGSIAHAYPQRTIVTSGVSKYFSAGGYRLGFCLIPTELNELKNALRAVISETYSCVSSPIQYAALKAYTDSPKLNEHLTKCTKLHEIAGNYLHQRFIAMGLACQKPQGGFYLMPDFRNFKEQFKARNIFTDINLCNAILEIAGVAMLPGSEFGMNQDMLSVRVASVDYDGIKALDALDKSPQDVVNVAMPNLIEGCDRLAQFLTD